MDEGIEFFYESKKCSRQVAVLSEWRLLGLFKKCFVKSSGALSSLMDVIFFGIPHGNGGPINLGGDAVHHHDYIYY